LSQADDRGTTDVVLSGPVTLAEAPRWKEALLGAFSAGRPVRIDLESAGPWDLAGLQLLISALATGRRGGVPVRLDRVPRVFLAIADQAGLTGRLAEAIDGRLD
jgi:anti-anti-sigma regulatory factor